MKITCDTDRYVNELIREGEYSFLFKDLIVLDIGCNVGLFSLSVHKLAKQIYAVDLAKENIENFNTTIRENNIERIKTYHCAIAGKTGTRTHSIDPEPGLGGFGLGQGAGEIMAYSVKDFMTKEDIKYIDILKIDVEGAEYEIFDASDFPASSIGTIIGEYHNRDLGVDHLKERLTYLGYRFKEYPNNHFIAKR